MERKAYHLRRRIKASTAAQIAVSGNTGDFDYGYQIWSGRKTKSFLFNGHVRSRYHLLSRHKNHCRIQRGNRTDFPAKRVLRHCSKILFVALLCRQTFETQPKITEKACLGAYRHIQYLRGKAGVFITVKRKKPSGFSHGRDGKNLCSS